jgi:hypothetical protein
MANPIGKVTSLLKDMQAQLEKEAEEDETINEKMTCWCDKTDPAWKKSIDDKETYVEELQTLIESTAANSARLKQELKNHNEDLTKSQQSLDTATALREKQATEFTAEEKDMLQSISALDAAIVVLSKHFGAPSEASFMDRSRALRDAANLARQELERHHALLQGKVTPSQRRTVLNMGSTSPDKNAYLQQTPTFRQNYSPQSGEIFGILKQMKETFGNNLKESQNDEAAAKKAFDDLKAAKLDEISATKAAIEEKSVQLADSDEKNAQSKEDLINTNAMITDENGMLVTVKQKCEESKAEYERRSALRREEIQSVAQAISLLTSDAARDQFSKSFSPAFFLQLRSRRVRTSSAEHRKRSAAANLLKAAAARAKQNSQLVANGLAMLAASSKLDAFTKVKEAIDKMVEELLQEKADEIKHRDSCISELHDNEVLTEREERSKADLESKKEGLEMSIKDLSGELKNLNSEIADLQLQIKRKGEDRELQNKDFQQTVADHRESQKLLHKAIAVLKVTYAKSATTTAEPELAMMQVGQRRQPTLEAPKGFETYERSDAGGGVVALLEQVAAETAAMEKEVIKDEQSLQEDYESFVKDANLAIASKQQAIVEVTEDKAKAEQLLNTVGQDFKASVVELEQLSNTAGALHMSCDFIMKNFDLRQEARDEEVEALRQAKAVLSGMQLP